MKEKSFKIMPDDMLEEKALALMDIAKRHEADGDQNELVDFLLELRKYAMMHNDDKVLRKVDTFTYFTEAYERFGGRSVVKNNVDSEDAISATEKYEDGNY